MTSLNYLSLVLVLFVGLILFFLIVLLVFKLTGIKFVLYQTKKGEFNLNNHQDQYEFIMTHFYHILDAQTKEQKKYNKSLIEKFDEKTEGFKNVSFKLLSMFSELQKQILDFRADYQVTKSLEKELKKELDHKNNIIERYSKGFLLSHATSAIQKIILTINGILKDSTIEEEDKNDRIIELESVLNSFNVSRINVEINHQFDPKTMSVVETIDTSEIRKENTVSKVISYGYNLNEGDTEKIISHAKVQVYIINQKLTGAH
jgi:molecular chaperone GrpE (heat shock protein)